MKKTCFLISPIGNEGTDTRDFADKIRTFLKYEVLTGLGYDCIRADDITKIGIISSDIISSIVNSELVIAVLEHNNANVYYELALRHATTKPCISIASRERMNRIDDPLPFDTQQERVFKYPYDDLMRYSEGLDIESQELVTFKGKLKKVISDYNEQSYEYRNPVTAVLNKVILPQGMTMQDVVSHLDKQIDLFHQNINAQLEDINKITKSFMPKHIESLVGDMYRNGSAMYISGEKEAFDTLCQETQKAERSIRTSRFAPQGISTSHSYFFEAVCRFGK